MVQHSTHSEVGFLEVRVANGAAHRQITHQSLCAAEEGSRQNEVSSTRSQQSLNLIDHKAAGLANAIQLIRTRRLVVLRAVQSNTKGSSADKPEELTLAKSAAKQASTRCVPW